MIENNFNFTNGVSYDVWYESKRLIDQLKKENDCYHKALKEIERICLEDTYTFADGTELRYDSLDDILDVINKAKEGNNE